MKKRLDIHTYKKIALFHDRFRTIGGSEKMALALANGLGCDIITAEVEPMVLKNLGFDNVKIISLREKLEF